MANVDIDPFGEHDRTESRTDDHTEPRMNIFLLLQWEDQRGNQTKESKKLHSEENLNELN